MHELTAEGIYPSDVYTFGAHYYGGGDPREHNVFGQVFERKNRPNRSIKVYRAVPKDVPAGSIKQGDWVTPSRSYAAEHGRANLNNEYKIQSKTVRANELFTDGNSILEWGYDPQPRDVEHDRARQLATKQRRDTVQGGLEMESEGAPALDPYAIERIRRGFALSLIHI